MNRVLLLASLPLLAAAVLAQDRAPPDPAAAVPRERLPVLGTVGDLPPEGERLVVALTAAGAAVVDGKSMDLDGLRQVLRERADRLREEDPPRLSRLHVVLRADRDASWINLQWAMQACADPAVRVPRILFAAVPEDGGAEGAMALFLPSDRGLPPTEPAPALRFPLRLQIAEPAVDPGAALHAHLERAFADVKGGSSAATVDADGRLPAGAVLETVDVLLRWGVRTVLLKGTSLNREGRFTVPQGPAPTRVHLVLFDHAVGAPLPDDPAPPAVARVTGRMAGQTSSPAAILLEAHVVDEDTEIVEEAADAPPLPFRLRPTPAPPGKPDPEIASAVEAGLGWLARHASPEGNWDADGFEKHCGKERCGGTGGPLYDPGVTGLALLAFLGNGETHKSPKHGHLVRNGLRYLKGIQDREGCIGPRTAHHFVYNHAAATLALAQAYGATRSPLFQSPAQSAVDFILECRNPYLAWRYGIKPQDNDTSVTAWMVTALATARRAGLDVDPDAFEGAQAWLRKVTDPATGRAGYTFRGNGPARPQELMDRFPADRSESMTAMATWIRLLCGQEAGDPAVQKGIGLCAALPPKWSTSAGTIDQVYWLFGTLALNEAGGPERGKWNGALKAAALQGQKRDRNSHRDGSFEPADPWASEGGRVYSTAMMVLSLE